MVEGSFWAGGFAGGNQGKIENSYSESDIKSQGGAGGFSASNSGVILNCSSNGNVSITGGYGAGGIVASNSGLIRDSFSSSVVTGFGRNVGGLVGENLDRSNLGRGEIINSYSNGDVTGNRNVGGLVGINNADISQSFSNGNSKGNQNNSDTIGALIGENFENGIVKNSFSTGEAVGKSKIGGLVGVNRDQAMIITSFSTGFVNGDIDFAGFAGVNSAIIENSYWDLEGSKKNNATGRGSSDGVEGLISSQMQGTQAKENMTGFDWENIWKTSEGYPILRWQNE